MYRLLYTGTTASRASHLSESVRVPLLLYNSTAPTPTTTVLRSYTHAHLLPYLIVISMPIALFRLHVTYVTDCNVISGLTVTLTVTATVTVTVTVTVTLLRVNVNVNVKVVSKSLAD